MNFSDKAHFQVLSINETAAFWDLKAQWDLEAINSPTLSNGGVAYGLKVS